MAYKFVAGLEIHVQLKTKSKMFCSCPTEGPDTPNSRVCPICLGHPGTLPVINKEAVLMTLALGKAMNARINRVSKFHRKNYFYPDLPKGYQITQYDVPLIEDGVFVMITGKKVPIRRIHLEEDAAKSVHIGSSGRLTGSQQILLDFNRSGIPLAEIVTEPVFESPEEVAMFVEELQATLRYLGISDAMMENGQLRCDVNVSVEVDGKEGTRVEIKNMNSTKAIRQALSFEYERHVRAYEAGVQLQVETRTFDEQSGETKAMRRKETSEDYRYFPEPDLLELHVTDELMEEANKYNGSFHEAYKDALTWLGREKEARALALNKEQFSVFKALVTKGGDIKYVSRAVLIELPNMLSEEGKSWDQLNESHLSSIIDLLTQGKITMAVARELLWQTVRGNDPLEYARSHGLLNAGATDLEAVVADVLAKNPDVVEKYKKGNTNVLSFLVGQVMKQTKGTAKPDAVREVLIKRLSE
ncbi:Asp-tRNA(Asn)/Glu-tRNA(Gln) amidotransferase subunit GatB [Coprothermobacteraceae bacterium]|nr:Asp-tRNA(Asn)/Glu-tRNA(Gln) amidotransferase subunit GatB [Coprothermobacteraceae bacterium]